MRNELICAKEDNMRLQFQMIIPCNKFCFHIEVILRV
jgi:hypothetical protein